MSEFDRYFLRRKICWTIDDLIKDNKLAWDESDSVLSPKIDDPHSFIFDSWWAIVELFICFTSDVSHHNRNFSLETVTDHNKKKWIVVRLNVSTNFLRKDFILCVEAFIKKSDGTLEPFESIVEDTCDLKKDAAVSLDIFEIEEDFFVEEENFSKFASFVEFVFEVPGKGNF